jgi:hypothetical protein
MTEKLPYMPCLIAFVLILAGYHFAAIELKILGGLYLGWASLIHLRNIRLVRYVYEKERQII